MDSHVHLAHSGTLSWVGDTLAENLRASLWHGVTTVVDVGGPTSLFEVRDSVAAGDLVGPEILATGPFLTTVGSHPCEASPDPDLCVFVEPDTAESAAITLRDAGADLLKVALADAAFTDWPTPRLDPAVITVAAGVLPVLAHVDADADVIDAVAAGVTQLAHPPFAGPIGDLARSTVRDGDVAVHTTLGAFAAVGDLVEGRLDPDDPTLIVTDAVRGDWKNVAANPGMLLPGWPEASSEWAADAAANLGVLYADGVTLLPGSDAGYYFVAHGTGLHHELAGLVALGLTPEEVLVAATWTPRRQFGLAGGEVVAGAPADLLVLSEDPRVDVGALDQIDRVIRAGTVWTREALRELDPGHPPTMCLESADCETGRCDPATRRCAPACDPPWATAGQCDPTSWCMPEDGVAAPAGVCHEEAGCDLYAQDCAPDWYGEACVPLDLDTNTCWPAGPRLPGERCAADDPALRCASGSFCSVIDDRCYLLCDPSAEDPACPREQSCWLQRGDDGSPWFGVCG